MTGGELLIRASDVTIDGLELTGGQASLQQGNIDADNASRVTLRRVHVHDSMGACISITGGSGHRITDSTFARCQQQGYHVASGASDVQFLRNTVRENNSAFAPGPRVDTGWEAGGGKMSRTTGALYEDNLVYGNGGPGMWCDLACRDVTYRGNVIHHNTTVGLFFEISDGGLIEGNTLYENGWSGGSNAYSGGAGIYVSTSRNVMVRGNVLAWNKWGIAFSAQNRSESETPSTNDGLRSESNVIVTDGQPRIHGWYQNDGKRLDVAGNGSSGDRYWTSAAEPQSARFEWATSPRSTLAQYVGTPGGAGASYLTTAEKDAILAAAGVP